MRYLINAVAPQEAPSRNKPRVFRGCPYGLAVLRVRLADVLQVDLNPERLEELDRDLRARNLSERRRSSVLRLVMRLKRVV